MDSKHHEIINQLWQSAKESCESHKRFASKYQAQADALEALMAELIKQVLNSKEAEKCQWWKRKPKKQR